MSNIHTKSDAFMADLRRAYRAEYARSPELQAEFIEAADYAAFMISQSPAMIAKMRDHYEDIMTEAALRRAENAGRVRTLHS